MHSLVGPLSLVELYLNRFVLQSCIFNCISCIVPPVPDRHVSTVWLKHVPAFSGRSGNNCMLSHKLLVAVHFGDTDMRVSL